MVFLVAQEGLFSDIASIISSLAGTIGHQMFPSGDLAGLRRMQITSPHPAYWRLLFSKIPENWRGEAQEKIWALTMKNMAIMAPDIHTPKMSIGTVLALIALDSGGDPSIPGNPMEARLLALLSAPEKRLEDHIRLMARFLRSKEKSIDWVEMFYFLITKDRSKKEVISRKIAKSFYEIAFSHKTEGI